MTKMRNFDFKNGSTEAMADNKYNSWCEICDIFADGLNCRLQVSAGQCRLMQVSAGQCRSVQVNAG
jgi:hypothetical protein